MIDSGSDDAIAAAATSDKITDGEGERGLNFLLNNSVMMAAKSKRKVVVTGSAHHDAIIVGTIATGRRSTKIVRKSSTRLSREEVTTAANSQSLSLANVLF